MWLRDRDREKGVRNENTILTWAREEQRGEEGAEDDEQRRRAGTIRSD